MSSNEYHWQSEFQRGLEDELTEEELEERMRMEIIEAQDDAGLFE